MNQNIGELVSKRSKVSEYIEEHQFHANWKTPTGNANTCLEVKVIVTDGTSIFAYFKLK